MFPDSQPAEPGTISSGLLSDVRQRDGAAWRRLVNLYGPLAYRWCRESGLEPNDAADILQEVFCAVLTGIERFHRSQPGDTFRGWLRTITKNKIRDALRRRGRQPHITSGVDPTESFDPIAMDPPEGQNEPENELLGLLSRALETIRHDFRPETWSAFYRSAVEGHSALEIAADCGMSAKAVRQAKYRVLLRLREELEPVD